MEDDFLKDFVVKRGFIFSSLDKISYILTNVHKYKIVLTDVNGKKAHGKFDDENFDVDIILKFKNVGARRIEGVYGWKLSMPECDLLLREKGKTDFGLSLTVYRPKSEFDSDMDDDIRYFDHDVGVNMTAEEEGFVMKGCKISVVY
uniref:Uncharacterized protein n=1 Tax=Panagrolaimus sp. ES5 TaxID=591445 RepID=A0AC34G510_9BILA